MRPQGDWTTHGDPRHISKTIRESYEALGGQKPIPLWQLHAPDHRYPIEETLKPVREAVDEGLIRFVGLSNVSVVEIKKSRRVVEIISVQNRYNPWCRDPEKDGVLEYCEKEGLTFLPWSPLGGSGQVQSLKDISVIADLARQKGISPQRLVLAWLLKKSTRIIPIPGASRLSSLEDSVQATQVKLTDDEFKKVDQLI